MTTQDINLLDEEITQERQTPIRDLAAIKVQNTKPFIISQFQQTQSLDSIWLTQMCFAQIKRFESSKRQNSRPKLMN